MKRVVLSIISGICFPILYSFVVGFLNSFLFPHYDLMTMEVYGQPSMGLILAPVALPVWIYDFMRFHHYFGLGLYLNTFWFRLIWIVGFNFSLYIGLSYLLFWYFDWFKFSKPIAYQDPPPPPEF